MIIYMLYIFLSVIILVVLLLVINFLLSEHKPDKVKSSQFECGFSSFREMSRTPFRISYYINEYFSFICMLFGVIIIGFLIYYCLDINILKELLDLFKIIFNRFFINIVYADSDFEDDDKQNKNESSKDESYEDKNKSNSEQSESVIDENSATISSNVKVDKGKGRAVYSEQENQESDHIDKKRKSNWLEDSEDQQKTFDKNIEEAKKRSLMDEKSEQSEQAASSSKSAETIKNKESKDNSLESQRDEQEAIMRSFRDNPSKKSESGEISGEESGEESEDESSSCVSSLQSWELENPEFVDTNRMAKKLEVKEIEKTLPKKPKSE